MDSTAISKGKSTLTPEEAVSNVEVTPSSTGRNLDKQYVCDACKKSFTRKDTLIRHKKFCSDEKSHACNLCEKSFVQKSDLRRHISIHSKLPPQHNCDQCSEVFSKKIELLKHRKIHSPPIQYSCDQCSEVFSKKMDLLKHRKIHTKPPMKFSCNHCFEEFTRKSELSKHERVHRPLEKFKCSSCEFTCNKKSFLFSHIRIFHTAKSEQSEPPAQGQSTAQSESSAKSELYEKVKHFQRQNALNVFTNTTFQSNEENDKDFHVFFDSMRPDVLNELNYQIELKKRMKWSAKVKAILSRTTKEGDVETATPYFHSNTVSEFNDYSISIHLEEAFAKILKSFENYTQRGSGWTLEKVEYLELAMAKM